MKIKFILFGALFALGMCAGVFGPQLIASQPVMAKANQNCLCYSRTTRPSVLVKVVDSCRKEYKLRVSQPQPWLIRADVVDRD